MGNHTTFYDGKCIELLEPGDLVWDRGYGKYALVVGEEERSGGRVVYPGRLAGEGDRPVLLQHDDCVIEARQVSNEVARRFDIVTTMQFNRRWNRP